MKQFPSLGGRTITGTGAQAILAAVIVDLTFLVVPMFYIP